MFEKIREIIAEYKDMDASEIQMTSTFEELDLDSLDMVELVMEVEEKLGITIEMSESIVTIEDLIKVIEEK